MLFVINCRLLFAALVSFHSSSLIVVSVSLDEIFPLIYRRINIANCFIAANRCNHHHHCLPRAIHLFAVISTPRAEPVSMMMYEWPQTNSAGAAATSRAHSAGLFVGLFAAGGELAPPRRAYSTSSIRRRFGHL